MTDRDASRLFWRVTLQFWRAPQSIHMAKNHHKYLNLPPHKTNKNMPHAQIREYKSWEYKSFYTALTHSTHSTPHAKRAPQSSVDEYAHLYEASMKHIPINVRPQNHRNGHLQCIVLDAEAEQMRLLRDRADVCLCLWDRADASTCTVQCSCALWWSVME